MTSIVALALTGIVTAAPVSAQEGVVDAPTLAQRIVLVSISDLANRSGRAKVEQQLRTAAIAVCDQQYPDEPGTYDLLGCYAGSFYDAQTQLSRISAHRPAAQEAAAQQLRFAVRAR
jgi:UrcA family protein